MKVHTKVWLALFLLSDVPYDICINVPNHVYLPWVNVHLAKCLNSVLNVKALEGTFNQEKALVGAPKIIIIMKLGSGLPLHCIL